MCIPTYNGARYLREAITSVLDQTVGDLELIVVDDCSTDATRAIVSSFEDSRITFVENPARLGLVENWNRCLELAGAEYVCVFHQDDVMLPRNLHEKIKALQANPSAGMAYSDVLQIDSEGNLVSGTWFAGRPPEAAGLRSGQDLFRTLLEGANVICCPSVVLRRGCYEHLGGFDPRLPFTADFEMWMRVSLFYDVAYLPDTLVKYRRHEDMETARFIGIEEFEHMYRAKTLVLEKYPERTSAPCALKWQVAQAFERQALAHAGRYQREHRYAAARDCLALAIKVHGATVATSYDDYTDWFLSAIDEVWREDPSAPAGSPSVAELQSALEAQQHFLDVARASAGWKLVTRGWELQNRLFPPGTRRRGGYDSIRRGIRGDRSGRRGIPR